LLFVVKHNRKQQQQQQRALTKRWMRRKRVEKTTKLFLIFSLHHLQSVNDEQKFLLLCLTSTNRIMNFSISSREKAKFACEFDERLLMMDGWMEGLLFLFIVLTRKLA